MDSVIRFECPVCGKAIKANATAAGRRVRCPGRDCGATVVVPQPFVLVPASPFPEADAAPRPVWPWLLGAVGTLILVAVGVSIWLLTLDRHTAIAATPPDNPTTAAPVTPSPTSGNGAKPMEAKPALQQTAVESKAPKLPGKRGPRLVYADARDPGVEASDIYDIYVDTSVPLKTPKPAQLPMSFPSGTKSINLMIEFGVNPPNMIAADCVVQSSAGRVDTSPKTAGPVATSMYIDYQRTLCLFLTPSHGAFEDGPHQALLRINGKAFATLNFGIGD